MLAGHLGDLGELPADVDGLADHADRQHVVVEVGLEGLVLRAGGQAHRGHAVVLLAADVREVAGQEEAGATRGDGDVEHLVVDDGVERRVELPGGGVERGQVGPDPAVDAGQLAPDEDAAAGAGERQHAIGGDGVPAVEGAVGQGEGGHVVPARGAGAGEPAADVQDAVRRGQRVDLGVAGRVGVRVARRVPRLAAVEGGVEGQDGAGAVDERQAATGRAADRAELPADRDHARGRVDGERPHDVVRARRPRQQRAGGGVERRQARTAGATGLAEVAAGVDRGAVRGGREGPHRLVGAGGEGRRRGAGGAIEAGHPGVGSAADGAELTAREERATRHQEAGHPAVRRGLEAGDEVGRAGRSDRGEARSGSITDRAEARHRGRRSRRRRRAPRRAGRAWGSRR